MPRFMVTETKTVTLTHVIEANDAAHAKNLMQDPLHRGLRDILEDDCETEYEVLRLWAVGDFVIYAGRKHKVLDMQDAGHILKVHDEVYTKVDHVYTVMACQCTEVPS